VTGNLSGRRVLITGATGGIGRELASQAVAAGAKVMVTGRSEDRLDELERELNHAGGEAVGVRADLTREEDRQALADAVKARWGGLDVLVNNAGVGAHGHFSTSDEAILREVMEVNFFAPADLMRLALPLLRASEDAAIVNVVSMCGRCAMPAWPEYSASKFALAGLSEALRAEFARWDIRVLSVLPGLTRGGLGGRLLRRDGKMKINYDAGMKPEYVASAVWKALARGRKEVVLGGDARWMLRVQRFFPWFVDRMLARKVRQLYSAS
jgi:short-subunit dehydrogenase